MSACFVCLADDAPLHRVCRCSWAHAACFAAATTRVATHSAKCPVCLRHYRARLVRRGAPLVAADAGLVGVVVLAAESAFVVSGVRVLASPLLTLLWAALLALRVAWHVSRLLRTSRRPVRVVCDADAQWAPSDDECVHG